MCDVETKNQPVLFLSQDEITFASFSENEFIFLYFKLLPVWKLMKLFKKIFCLYVLYYLCYTLL